MNDPERHTRLGTNYGAEGAESYATHKHGPDGDRFLDISFIPVLSADLTNKSVVDIGAGAGNWAKLAAEHGATVFASDIQEGMVSQAKKTLAGVEKSYLSQADGASLPLRDNSADLVISINVACNLPETSSAGKDDGKRDVGFAPHFQTISRILKSGGEGVITAPANFGEIFTDGAKDRIQTINRLEEVINQLALETDKNQREILLSEISGVFRATFAKRENKWKLITDESDLAPGEQILRKLPGLVVPNYYHSHEEYVNAIDSSGLKIAKIDQLCFTSEVERQAYNQTVPPDKQLGPEYVGKNPFNIYFVKK